MIFLSLLIGHTLAKVNYLLPQLYLGQNKKNYYKAKQMELIDHDLEISAEIGKGGWSIVRQGYLRSIDTAVAVKTESVTEETSLLLREEQILRHLQGIEGVPLLYKSGTWREVNYIAMEKLHSTLAQLKKRALLHVEEVMRRGEQLVKTMELIHKRGIIHQDLQPNNLMASEGSFTSYFIDFGLATSIRSRTNSVPRTVGILGTPSYSSRSALLGLEQDFKDDLEALGYNLVWLVVGELPWEKLATKGTIAKLKNAKFHTPISQVCQGCPLRGLSQLLVAATEFWWNTSQIANAVVRFGLMSPGWASMCDRV
jgi:serine/threonine protein kinase